MMSALVKIFLDALGLAQQIRRVHLRKFDEFLQCLHRLFEFLGEFLMFLVLPGVPQRAEAGLQQDHPILEVAVETLQLFREPPHLLWIHDCLGHRVSSRLWLSAPLLPDICHHAITILTSSEWQNSGAAPLSIYDLRFAVYDNPAC